MGRGVIEHTMVNYGPPTPHTQAHKKNQTQKGKGGRTHEHFAHLKFEAKK
jgi:hypothetical protein